MSCLRGKLARAVLRGGGGGNTASLLDYDGQTRQVRDISHGTVYATRFTSPQGSLIPRKAEESLVVYHPKAPRRPVGLPLPAQQLWLFELGYPA